MVRIGCSWLGGPWLGYHPAIRKLISALGLIALALFAACSPPSPPLTSKGVVRLPRDPKPPTAIDLLSLDPRNHLLYVAHSSSNSLDMIDTRTMKVVGSVAGLLNVKATTPTSDPNIIFSSNGNDGTLSVIDVPARKVLEKIKIGGNPDAISYDPSHDVVAVGVTAEKKLKLVDVRTRKITASIELPGTPEQMAVDSQDGTIFVAINDKDEVAVIDVGTQQVTKFYRSCNIKLPKGVAFDPESKRLFVADSPPSPVPGTLSIVDVLLDRCLGSVDLGKGTDQLGFNSHTHHVYTADGGSSFVSIVDSISLKPLGVAGTGAGGGTLAVDSTTDMVYVGLEKRGLIAVYHDP